jgi:hypothetical protein
MLCQRIERSGGTYDASVDKYAAIAVNVVAQNRDILDRLIERGAPRRITFGNLESYAQTRDVELVRLMLEYGAERSQPAGSPSLPLSIMHMAYGSPRAEEMLAVLREYGIDWQPGEKMQTARDVVLPGVLDMLLKDGIIEGQNDLTE